MPRNVPEQLGPDDQTARLNNTPLKPEDQEDTRDPLTMYREWETEAKKKLGVSDFRADVKPDAAVLHNALLRIKNSGAPDPIIVREVVAYPPHPEQSFEVDVYVFTHFLNPRLQYRATEYLLALNPNVVVNDLQTAGIRRQ